MSTVARVSSHHNVALRSEARTPERGALKDRKSCLGFLGLVPKADPVDSRDYSSSRYPRFHPDSERVLRIVKFV